VGHSTKRIHISGVVANWENEGIQNRFLIGRSIKKKGEQKKLQMIGRLRAGKRGKTNQDLAQKKERETSREGNKNTERDFEMVRGEHNSKRGSGM